MAKSGEADEVEMTEEQRLSLLERSVSMNRIVLFTIAVVIVVGLSVTITVAIISAISEDKPQALAAEINNLQTQITELKESLKETEVAVLNLNTELPAMKQALESSGTEAFKKIMLDQEKSYQAFLKITKSGMYDLANMIPGSRTWLEHYTEQVDAGLQRGLLREQALERVKTKAPDG